MVSPENDDGTHNGDEHAVEIEAGDARRSDGGKQEAAEDRSDDAKHYVEQETLTRAIDDLAADETCDQPQ